MNGVNKRCLTRAITANQHIHTRLELALECFETPEIFYFNTLYRHNYILLLVTAIPFCKNSDFALYQMHFFYIIIVYNYQRPTSLFFLSIQRWNVEQFFKWIKQHLHIKSFYGTSENAVYTQIWIVVCSFLLIALAKKKWNLDQSLYTIPQTIGFILFEEVPLNQLFNKSKNLAPVDDYPNLFSINES